MSLQPHGIPCSGPLYLLAAISESAFFACCIARSSQKLTTQLSTGLYFLRRVKYIVVSSTDVTCFVRINSESCRTDQNATSSRFAGRFTPEASLMRIG